MSVPSSTRRITYTGNAVTTAFPVTFPWLSNAQLVVSLRLAAGTTYATQTEGVHYTVDATGSPPSGGTVNMVAAPASGDSLKIERVVDYTQPTAFRDAGPFSAARHENSADLTVYQTEQLADGLSDLTTRVAAVEAIGIPTSTFAGLVLRLATFTTNAVAVENGFPISVTLPADWTATGVELVRCIEAGDPTIRFDTPPAVGGWRQVGTTLYLNFISGLKPNTSYAVTIQVTNVAAS